MLSFLFSKAGFWLICIVIIAVALAVFARNCRKIVRPDPVKVPKVNLMGPYSVVRVQSGQAIVVSNDKRRASEFTIILDKVVVPTLGIYGQQATDSLQRLAGSEIMVQYEKRGLFRGEADEENNGEAEVEVTNGQFAAMARDRGPILGVVLGQSGANLNKAQVSAGWAECTSDAPADWKAAQKAAQKARLGKWGVR